MSKFIKCNDKLHNYCQNALNTQETGVKMLNFDLTTCALNYLQISTPMGDNSRKIEIIFE